VLIADGVIRQIGIIELILLIKIDGTGKHLLPELLTDKFILETLAYTGDLYTESKAAVAGGDFLLICQIRFLIF
jgi:dihydroorotase-like cyclic amidohydrolase